MRKIWSWLLQLALILPIFGADNFCGEPICYEVDHIDCMLVDGVMPIPASCKNATVLNLSALQLPIVKRHNVLRNKVAGGLFKNRASRMGTLRWDSTLANLAEKNVRKCNFTYDACANTPDYYYVGQNIARAVYPKTDKRTNLKIILDLMDEWFAQNKVTTLRNLKFYPYVHKRIRNYCQMVHELTTRVGCAAMRYEQNNRYVMLFTCLYNSKNKENWPVYLIGATGSKCKTGKNSGYKNLCSVAETYNVNEYYLEYDP